MMNFYQANHIFYIDGKEVANQSWTFLADSSTIDDEIEWSGNTFESLWQFYEKYPLTIPANRWLHGIFQKKRRIEFFRNIKTWVDDGSLREWKFVAKYEVTTAYMDDLKRSKIDDVIQYYKDRNMNTIPMEV